jgi:hypothetical protein
VEVDGAAGGVLGVDVVEDAREVRTRRRAEVDDRMREPAGRRGDEIVVRYERVGRVRGSRNAVTPCAANA